MNPNAFVEELLTLPSLAAQKQFLKSHREVLQNQEFADEVAPQLKAKADHFLRTKIEKTLQIVECLFCLAELTQNPLYRALGLRAKGNVYGIGQGDHKRAIDTYDQAADIYRVAGRQVEQAISQTGKIWSLAVLGRYEEALETGQWACTIFEAHEQWFRLAEMKKNMASIHVRLRDDHKALQLLNQVQALYQRMGEAGKVYLSIAELNRSHTLRNLGQFKAAICSSQVAHAQLAQLEQTIEAARAQLSLARIYFILGRYNEAQAILNQVRDVYLADERWGDAIGLELLSSDYLLQLRRFREVLDKCDQIRDISGVRGMRLEVGRTMLNEAIAYAGLHQYEKALDSLIEARHLFELEENQVFVATTEIETADILRRQGQFQQSLLTAQRSAAFFEGKGLVMEQARAHLLAAQAATALDNDEQARRLAKKVLEIGTVKDLPWLRYQARSLLGTLAEKKGQLQAALSDYQQAIYDLEWLQGRLMVEFRSDYLEDKQAVYENSVRLCLALNQAQKGLAIAERAKSRTLRELLDRRVTLQIQARDQKDEELVQQVQGLQNKRDQLYRRWEGGKETQQQAQQDIRALERQITQTWHHLLIRNADYAREADLWYAHQEESIPEMQTWLDEQSVLVEYFVAQQEIMVFVVTAHTIQMRRLPLTISQVNTLNQKFRLRLNLVPKSSPQRIKKMGRTTRRQLRQLYDLLIAPLSDALAGYTRLIIVPHGALHYLPFHALCDDDSYLLEKYEISYLPSANLLRHYALPQQLSSAKSAAKPAVPELVEGLPLPPPPPRSPPNAGGGVSGGQGREPGALVAFGYSNEGQLPYAKQEAESIAKIMGGQAFVEEEASLAKLREIATTSRVLHLATHGDFRADNPIFSGLTLHDGQLTTLDTFNLRLSASLVTLSACQTGRSVIGGGDELLGLTRAFLYAGAASLLLSLWRAYDHSTSLLMELFYRNLAQGHTKGSALRQAQRQFIHQAGQPSSNIPATYAHPYYWAPFFLVGHAGAL
ncbi:MAG: CHAT domain-containing protein [Ardenticatenaceae bacterium]